jgi:EAL domain-containing protein (putative c-di-GMP-specific phosphodiesterase class I)
VTVLDLDLVPALCAALEDGALQLHFQPEVDLRTGALTGMEGLLRWQHPDRGLLRAPEFLPVAEAAGLTRQIGRWVLRAGVTEVRTWHEEATDAVPRLWLNVSASQLTRPGFETEMERLVKGRALPPGALGLEFTEEAIGGPDLAAPRLLRRLRAIGVALAVDDFGTWYASLTTLDALPLDAVKLDGRFLDAMTRDLEGLAVIASIVKIAHRRRMRVVAEGVETVAAASRLAALGCDRATGHLFCGPLPVEQARAIAVGRRPGPWMRTAPRQRRGGGSPAGSQSPSGAPTG